MGDNKIKISVIVPIFGVEKYIERCARSLFEQTLDDIEYIFVDDCTKDLANLVRISNITTLFLYIIRQILKYKIESELTKVEDENRMFFKEHFTCEKYFSQYKEEISKLN